MASTSEVARHRAGMASLLEKTIEATGEIERRLDMEVESGEARSLTEAWLGKTQEDLASANSLPESDPASVGRFISSLLLRKARIHTLAVLRANETNNVHSLAVQARPVLECAGQVVLIFHHLIIAPDVQMKPERAIGKVTSRVDADFRQTLIRATKGNLRHKELLKMISDAAEAAAMSFGMPKPKKRKGKPLRETEKVAMLPGGKNWYGYLSDYFCHGEANWTGPSWQGGVGSMDMTHELTCMGLMRYLVDQVALMNAYASLCSVAGDAADGRADAALARLCKVRADSATLWNAALKAIKRNEARQV